MSSSPGKYEMNSMIGTEVTLNNKPYLYFAGTSYFQLHAHPELIEAAQGATARYGIGSATSRALTGTTPLLKNIENKIADFFDTEDAVYLPSGYLSNMAGMKALESLNFYDVIFMDEGAHYSLLEGAMITGKPVIYFKNRDVGDLDRKLSEHLNKNERPLIASDGLFPISAKLAPIDQYLAIVEKYDGVVWIDDAHGVGILGKNGRGSGELLEVKSPRLYMGATLSKAFGAYGGIIPGSSTFIEQIKKESVMTGSNSPMNAAVAAGIKGLEIVQNPEFRDHLRKNTKYLKQGLSSLGINTDDNDIPIVSFNMGNAAKMIAVHESLKKKGVFIQYTHYQGAGPNGVLRIVVSSEHTTNQINKLIISLRETI